MSEPIPGERTFQCGTGEMGTLYWSKDPEVDGVEFYRKGPDGEYVRFYPSELLMGYPPEIEGQPGTFTNPLRATGTIREIAERVKSGKWTTLDLNALADYVLERER